MSRKFPYHKYTYARAKRDAYYNRPIGSYGTGRSKPKPPEKKWDEMTPAEQNALIGVYCFFGVLFIIFLAFCAAGA